MQGSFKHSKQQLLLHKLRACGNSELLQSEATTSELTSLKCLRRLTLEVSSCPPRFHRNHSTAST